MTPLGHAGHYATWIAIAVPPIAVAVWVVVLSRRERRKRGDV